MTQSSISLQEQNGARERVEFSEICESCVVYNGGFSRTLVWFGGIHEPFLSRTVTEQIGVNGVFLRDIRSDWYMQGLAGMGDFTESAKRLGEIISGLNSECIAFGGQSSGGYGALRYSHALSPDICIAFAPQTRNLTDAAGRTLPWTPVVSLSELYEAQPSATPIVFHLSRSEKLNPSPERWNDWEQIAPFLNINNVTVVRHPSDQHAVTLWLYGLEIFYKVIDCDMKLYARRRLT